MYSDWLLLGHHSLVKPMGQLKVYKTKAKRLDFPEVDLMSFRVEWLSEQSDLRGFRLRSGQKSSEVSVHCSEQSPMQDLEMPRKCRFQT